MGRWRECGRVARAPTEKPGGGRPSGLGKGGVPCSAAGAEVAFAEEAVVVAGDEAGFDLAHGVEHDADDDQTRKARPGMAPGRRETRLLEAPMSPTLPSTRVLANLVAHRGNSSFPMSGIFFQ